MATTSEYPSLGYYGVTVVDCRESNDEVATEFFNVRASSSEEAKLKAILRSNFNEEDLPYLDFIFEAASGCAVKAIESQGDDQEAGAQAKAASATQAADLLGLNHRLCRRAAFGRLFSCGGHMPEIDVRVYKMGDEPRGEVVDFVPGPITIPAGRGIVAFVRIDAHWVGFINELGFADINDKQIKACCYKALKAQTPWPTREETQAMLDRDGAELAGEHLVQRIMDFDARLKSMIEIVRPLFDAALAAA